MLANDNTYDDLKKDLIRLYSDGKFEEARKIFEKAEEEFKKDPEFLGEIIKTIQQRIDGFSKSPNDNIKQYAAKLGQFRKDYINAKEDDKASKCFDEMLKVLKTRPNDIAVTEMVIKSLRCENRDDVDKKIKEIFELVRILKNEIESYKSAGDSFLHENEYNIAFEYFNKILKEEPDNSDFIGNTIESLRYAHRFNEASKKIKEISERPFIPIKTKIILKKQCGWLHFDRKQYKEHLKHLMII